MIVELFNYIGIIAFAASGALTALDEKYDVLGFYVLGFITSFGGGAIRTLLIGAPIELIWSQNTLFIVGIVFDAIGLGIIVAATLTGSGGGVIPTSTHFGQRWAV